MINYKNCIRCGKDNTELLMVNTRISLNFKENRNSFGVIEQRVIEPTNAMVCKDCGHIEFFFNWNSAI